jgi:hypothetical protein
MSVTCVTCVTDGVPQSSSQVRLCIQAAHWTGPTSETPPCGRAERGGFHQSASGNRWCPKLEEKCPSSVHVRRGASQGPVKPTLDWEGWVGLGSMPIIG